MTSRNFWKHSIYQIKQPYYMDCGMPGRPPGEDVTTVWKRCTDNYDCSTKCVIRYQYYRTYKGGCPSTVMDPCEAMARLHNGGQKGCEMPSTLNYWEDIVKP
uniref:lysozyme n=1 Tax=Angiostrongylus cantonensis TaxID=6313 RepID=A0A0K0D2W3_ANGCA